MCVRKIDLDIFKQFLQYFFFVGDGVSTNRFELQYSEEENEEDQEEKSLETNADVIVQKIFLTASCFTFSFMKMNLRIFKRFLSLLLLYI